MLDTPCFEVMWRVLATQSIRQFPLHFPSLASPCAITFQVESKGWLRSPGPSRVWSRTSNLRSGQHRTTWAAWAIRRLVKIVLTSDCTSDSRSIKVWSCNCHFVCVYVCVFPSSPKTLKHFITTQFYKPLRIYAIWMIFFFRWLKFLPSAWKAVGVVTSCWFDERSTVG